uniref:Uncharacterized protein n=1 Tax=Physcomitrium patens TaxID=3218 RepID=A0A2K1KHD7_PHYPA|nr:hypothetical protein PHYPA_009576 [Physcomitrium patens]
MRTTSQSAAADTHLSRVTVLLPSTDPTLRMCYHALPSFSSRDITCRITVIARSRLAPISDAALQLQTPIPFHRYHLSLIKLPIACNLPPILYSLPVIHCCGENNVRYLLHHKHVTQTITHHASTSSHTTRLNTQHALAPNSCRTHPRLHHHIATTLHLEASDLAIQHSFRLKWYGQYVSSLPRGAPYTTTLSHTLQKHNIKTDNAPCTPRSHTHCSSQKQPRNTPPHTHTHQNPTGDPSFHKEVVFKNTVDFEPPPARPSALPSEPVKRPPLPLQRIHHIHRRHRLPPSVLRVRHRVPDHILQKYLQHAASLLVNQPTDTLHSSTTSQTPDRRLRDTLDVITQHFPMTLRATLPKPLPSFATPRHRRTPFTTVTLNSNPSLQRPTHTRAPHSDRVSDTQHSKHHNITQ